MSVCSFSANAVQSRTLNRFRHGIIAAMPQMDPAGRNYPPRAYVFGEFGQRVRNVSRAWKTCVPRAHEHEPQWARKGKLADVSRAALRIIDLHFHDLRHAVGCRWLEAGWPIHHVQEMQRKP